MDSMTIRDIFRKLEDLKEYSKGKLTQCLADPTNESKLSQFKAAHKEWTEQFIRVQKAMADFIDGEISWMYTVDSDDIRAFSQLQRHACRFDENPLIARSVFGVANPLEELIKEDAVRSGIKTPIKAVNLETDKPVPQSITNRIYETLKIDTVYEYEIVGQNIIKITDDCYECELHLDRYSYYFTDAVNGGHRSVAYYVQSYYPLYKNPEKLYTDYYDFRHSVEASGWGQPAVESDTTKESVIDPQHSGSTEQAPTQVTDQAMIEAIKRIIDDAVANRKAANDGNVNKSYIIVGIIAGEMRLMHTFGIGGEMDSFQVNQCCCVKNIRIEGFTIWSDGKYNKEEVKKAIDFYKKGGEGNVREREEHH